MDRVEDNSKRASESDNASITILAVDDNDSLRYSLARSLQGGGYNVIEARNGAEALRLADDCPDLITLDVHLPDTSGFDICRILKGNPKTAHIPVLHISATFVDAEYRVRGLEAADGYLTEPISRDELLATVGALLRLKHAEREARFNAAEAEKARLELKRAHDELGSRVAQRTRELKERNDEVRELTGKLLKLQDDERRRLARELHDSTGQMLTVMKLNLDRLSRVTGTQQPDPLIAETISINNELSRQLRTLSYLLHPPLLEEAGLPHALGWYCEGFAERSGIKVDLEISPDFGRLPGDMEIAVFRVAQECLTNIHRHSGSTTATLYLGRTHEDVRLAVKDSGSGIAPDRLHAGKVVEGVGLMGIQERVRQFGGSLAVNSSAKGTEIIATFPVSGALP
jgi:signal transduction histidine kinase